MKNTMKKLLSFFVVTTVCLSNPLQVLATEGGPSEGIVIDEAGEFLEEPSEKNYDSNIEDGISITEESESEALTESLIEPEADDEIVIENEAEPETLINSNDDISLPSSDKGDVEVSRLDWWRMLIDAFHMTIEENDYPDNHYADINTSIEYYRDIMVATEFGLIDVGVAENVNALDSATREFCAYTLNLCVAYIEKPSTFTFSEKDNVEHPYDIQIAINEGWFQTVDGAFLPEKAITREEFNTLSDIAAKSYDQTSFHEGHKNE